MSSPLASLVAAAALFVASHFVLSATPVREFLAGAVGERPFLLLYSTLAIALLVWMASAYARAPAIELWPTTTFARYLALTVIALAVFLLVGGATTPNPTAVKAERLMKRPPAGVLKITRHPVMWGLGLWAIVHLIANGDVASLIFFGSLTVLALGGTLHLDRKKARTLRADWPAFAAATSNLPLAALIAGRARLAWAEIGWWRPALAGALYALLYIVHRPLFGVSPLGG